MDEKFFKEKEAKVMAGLKNFQRATVERIDHLFRQGRNRVLVADEVGLGKTLIARGCIAKMGVLRVEEGDNLFKVVYVCSNQNIARKNLGKLDVYNTGQLEKLSDSRLSMQHLRIVEQEIECEEHNRQTQLIPLTPQTSFSMTTGRGSYDERALMFHILRRLPRLKGLEEGLERRMIYGADQGWKDASKNYGRRVDNAELKTANTVEPYPQSVISEIENSKEYSDIIERLAVIIENNERIDSGFLNEIRRMFAQISVKRLQPDLVIMDEFQRFKFMLEEDESELGIIAHEFLNHSNPRVLLLSATPYKLYSTIEEMEDKPKENHYKEFNKVMQFLFKDPKEYETFEKAWAKYSQTLQFLSQNKIDVVLADKEEAEKQLYRGICRTERLSVMDGEDFINSDSTREPVHILPDDIRSYMETAQFLEDLQQSGLSLPIDYAKSCPFLLSYLGNYKLMSRLEKFFRGHPDRLKGKKGLLWLNTDRINNYQKLHKSNARLELLKKHLFQDHNSHLYLWVPPSLPYYAPMGVYKDAYKEGKTFSKILLFSSWEMVPKMIGSLVSYEAERLTIGEIASTLKNKKERRAAHYFTRSSGDDGDKKETRYPKGRIVGGSEWYLLYPSRWLSSLYNPITYLNQRKTLQDIQKEVKEKIEAELEKMSNLITSDQRQADNRWYLVAPMLMDGEEYLAQWINGFQKFEGKIRVVDMLNELKASGVNLNDLNLGRQPEDLSEVLTHMAIGGPVNCIYRTNGHNARYAVELTQVFIKRFNTPEATAVVALAYDRKNEDAHWQDLLRYCMDGCFQAMFDEYHHMLSDEVQFLPDSDREGAIHRKMCGTDDKSGTLKIRGRNYTIETPESLRERIADKAKDKDQDKEQDQARSINQDADTTIASANEVQTETETDITTNLYQLSEQDSNQDKDQGADHNSDHDSEQSPKYDLVQGEETTQKPSQSYTEDKGSETESDRERDKESDTESGKDKRKRVNRSTMRSHFAVGFTKGKGAESSDSKESIQDAFNSPLRPFVLASTSIGQEGLDFHYYCRKIMHWNLPGNPIDLEQREGRVNRFKCLAIRQNLARYYFEKGTQFKENVWKEIFQMATQDLLKPGESELTPFWCLGANQKIKIERIVPMYPLSRDQERYHRLIKILSLYRMTMGQARQEELVEYLLDSEYDLSQLKSLFMNLSPFKHPED